MAIFTDSPWTYRNDPLQFMEAGARTGLEARGQDLSQMEAGQRLRLSYDTLVARQANQRRQDSLKQAQNDAMNNYRAQQIQTQQDRLKQTAEKTQAAAEALNAAHADTAGFVDEAEKLGAAKALLKYPNADKTVVDHVMALEQVKTKPTPPDRETTTQLVEVAPPRPGKFHLFGPNEPSEPGVTNKVSTTRYISPSERLATPAVSAATPPLPTPAPAPADLVSVINPQGKRVRIKKTDFVNGQPPQGYSLPQ